MKEFKSLDGGRYVYADDIINLQELSLSFSSIFDGCGNFIISGCNVSGNSISSGFVYINGKVRKFDGGKNIVSYPIYIYEYNTVESVGYEDQQVKSGRTVYGSSFMTSEPTQNDLVTGLKPQYILVQADNKARRIGDAFFGRYSVSKDEQHTEQNIDGSLTVGGSIVASGIMQSNAVHIDSNGSETRMYHDTENGNFTTLSTFPNKHSFKTVATRDGQFKVYYNSKLTALVGSTGSQFLSPVQFEQIQVSHVRVEDHSIYSTGADSDGSNVLKINVRSGGVEGKNQHTQIGDGKGNVLVDINGLTHQTTFQSNITLHHGTPSISLKSENYTNRSEDTLDSRLYWFDKNGSVTGVVGYYGDEKGSSRTLRIHNAIGDIQTDNRVYITGGLTLNGKDVETEYVTHEALETRLDAIEIIAADEDTRKANEEKRVEAERGRVNAEKLRVQAEQTRDAHFKQIQTSSDQVIQAVLKTDESVKLAEKGRVQEEQSRVLAEKGRVTSEANRVSEFNALKQSAKEVTDEAIKAAEKANQAAENAKESVPQILHNLDMTMGGATARFHGFINEATSLLESAESVVGVYFDRQTKRFYGLDYNENYVKHWSDEDLYVQKNGNVLKNKVFLLKNVPYTWGIDSNTLIPVHSHVIMSETDYEKLVEKDNDMIYLIYEEDA